MKLRNGFNNFLVPIAWAFFVVLFVKKKKILVLEISKNLLLVLVFIFVHVIFVYVGISPYNIYIILIFFLGK